MLIVISTNTVTVGRVNAIVIVVDITHVKVFYETVTARLSEFRNHALFQQGQDDGGEKLVQKQRVEEGHAGVENLQNLLTKTPVRLFVLFLEQGYEFGQ